MTIVGNEWLVEAEACQPDCLRDLGLLQALCGQIVADLQLQVVGQAQWHQFAEPGGVTGLYLLTESHLACHTYPEYGLATFNLYCCRPRARWTWESELRRWLGAQQVQVHSMARGSAGVLATVREGASV